jgi:hypothetical protein
MTDQDKFSRRHGFEPQEREIRLRDAAPEDLREAMVQIAYESSATPTQLRAAICRVLKKRPDTNNWSDANVAGEVDALVSACEWYEVYDIVEAISDSLAEVDRQRWSDSPKELARDHFAREVNLYFRKEGIGWQLVDGRVQIREGDASERTLRAAQAALAETGRPTAAQELREAIRDLSRRPSPDVTGAIQHAMAALECVARDVAGDPKGTLGEVLKRHPGLVPPPLDQSVEKVWGYASEQARHVREGRVPDLIDAELVVGVACSVVSYLVNQAQRSGKAGK